jgi:EAL domain-containing protein (putative c-di-GMP-specific phosphodiesterase class I)
MRFMSTLLGAFVSSPALRLESLRDAHSGELVGREARFEPRDFSVRDEHGLVDRWALRSALAAAGSVADEHPPVPTHVDIFSITDVDHARELYQWLRTLTPHLPDQRLALEIDERFVAPYAETIGGFARAVRRLGIELVVDRARNCGGIEKVLRSVHCDAVKIDASLIDAIAFDRSARASTAEITRVAHGLGMYTIADGVLDRETWERARDLGCDRVQGLIELPI